MAPISRSYDSPPLAIVGTQMGKGSLTGTNRPQALMHTVRCSPHHIQPPRHGSLGCKGVRVPTPMLPSLQLLCSSHLWKCLLFGLLCLSHPSLKAHFKAHLFQEVCPNPQTAILTQNSRSVCHPAPSWVSEAVALLVTLLALLV